MRGHLLFSCGPPSSIPARSLDRNVFSPPCGVSSACPEDRVRRSCARIRLAGDGTPPATALQSIPFWIPDPEGEVSIVLTALGRIWKSTLLIIGDDQCLHRRPSRARFSLAVLSQLSDPSSDDRGRNRSNWHFGVGHTSVERSPNALHKPATGCSQIGLVAHFSARMLKAFNTIH